MTHVEIALKETEKLLPWWFSWRSLLWKNLNSNHWTPSLSVCFNTLWSNLLGQSGFKTLIGAEITNLLLNVLTANIVSACQASAGTSCFAPRGGANVEPKFVIKRVRGQIWGGYPAAAGCPGRYWDLEAQIWQVSIKMLQHREVVRQESISGVTLKTG